MNPTPDVGHMPARVDSGDDRPGAENTGRIPRNLAIFAVALSVLWLLVLVLPEPASVTATVVAMAAGAGTLAGAIVRFRPVGRGGWWLVAGSAVGLVAAVVIDRYGMEDGGVVGPPSQVLVALSLLALASGLALLGRRQPALARHARVLRRGVARRSHVSRVARSSRR